GTAAGSPKDRGHGYQQRVPAPTPRLAGAAKSSPILRAGTHSCAPALQAERVARHSARPSSRAPVIPRARRRRSRPRRPSLRPLFPVDAEGVGLRLGGGAEADEEREQAIAEPGADWAGRLAARLALRFAEDAIDPRATAPFEGAKGGGRFPEIAQTAGELHGVFH